MTDAKDPRFVDTNVWIYANIVEAPFHAERESGTPSAPGKAGRSLEVEFLYPVSASDSPELRVMGESVREGRR